LIKWGKYAIYLAIFTIFYNIIEGVVAILYGLEEESISLLGFGFDSFVEVFSAIIVLFQLIYREKIGEGKGSKVGKKKRDVRIERISTIIIGGLLILLGVSAVIGAVYRLATRGYPDTAVPGLVISFLSLTFMYFL